MPNQGQIQSPPPPPPIPAYTRIGHQASRIPKIQNSGPPGGLTAPSRPPADFLGRWRGLRAPHPADSTLHPPLPTIYKFYTVYPLRTMHFRSVQKRNTIKFCILSIFGSTRCKLWRPRQPDLILIMVAPLHRTIFKYVCPRITIWLF